MRTQLFSLSAIERIQRLRARYLLALIFSFAFAGCKSGTSSNDEPVAPSVYSAQFEYSGARSGSVSLIGTDSLVSTESVTIDKYLVKNREVGFRISRDTARFATQSSTGIEIVLNSTSPFTSGQLFSVGDTEANAAASIGFFSDLGNDSLGVLGGGGFMNGPNVFFAKKFTVRLTYAHDDTSGVALAGTFTGTFADTAGHQLSVFNGSFGIPK